MGPPERLALRVLLVEQALRAQQESLARQVMPVLRVEQALREPQESLGQWAPRAQPALLAHPLAAA